MTNGEIHRSNSNGPMSLKKEGVKPKPVKIVDITQLDETSGKPIRGIRMFHTPELDTLTIFIFEPGVQGYVFSKKKQEATHNHIILEDASHIVPALLESVDQERDISFTSQNVNVDFKHMEKDLLNISITRQRYGSTPKIAILGKDVVEGELLAPLRNIVTEDTK